MVGTAVGGIIGWSEPPPPADPASLRTLLTDLRLPPGPGDAHSPTPQRAHVVNRRR
jgi:hypothetical protein